MERITQLGGYFLKTISGSQPIKSHSNLLSRFWRRVFEKRLIRQLLGAGLGGGTLVLALTSPQPLVGEYSPPVLEVVSISPQAVELKTTAGVHYPLGNPRKVNQGFHSWHLGVDLEGQTGDPIYPVMKGKVVEVNYLPFTYGKEVIIDHGQEIYSLYAHLSEIKVKPNDDVTIDEVIGRVGSTGHSTGSHLHLEIIDQGKRINPLTLLEN